MSTPSDLLRELLDRVRRDLYAGRDDLWFPQQQMVKQALTYPARWLQDKAVELPSARYRQIMEEIISTIVRHGNLAGVTYRSRYILHCVQEHMRHHGDAYYAEGKSLRHAVTHALYGLERRARHPAKDDTIPRLSEVHQALQLGKRRPKKPANPALQPDLFGSAKGRRRP